jgi:hypothetical protein
VRGRPWQELLIDLATLCDLPGTELQNNTFYKARDLHSRIEANGGLEKATDADIAEIQRMHREIEDTHPKLYQDRQKMLDEAGKGRTGPIDSGLDRRK